MKQHIFWGFRNLLCTSPRSLHLSLSLYPSPVPPQDLLGGLCMLFVHVAPPWQEYPKEERA